jgi:uncharacterized SAM-binding protein YcdF (DUF218 family)
MAGVLLTPSTLLLLTLAVGSVLLWTDRFRAAGRRITTAAAVLLLLLAYGIPIDFVLTAFEKRYPAVVDLDEVGRVKWIVVLGGGHRSQRDLPVSSYPDPPSLYRIVEGIRLLHAIPGSRIIFSGGGAVDSITTASSGANLARALGVSNDSVTLEPRPESTEDEARIVGDIVKGEPFVLVTSAVHMTRAVAAFRRRGLNPIPAPTDHRSGLPMGFFPSSRRVADGDAVVHEILGIAAMWLKGAM